MIIPSSLDEYVKMIREDGDFLPDCLGALDEQFIHLSQRLILTGKKHPFLRRILIRRLFSRLVRLGLIGRVRMKFSYSRGERAYMRDSGVLCFGMPYLFSATGGDLFKVAMHELAHLLLLGSPQYGELLSLDAEYFSRYGRDLPELIHLSPTELYATLISVDLMKNAIALCDKSVTDVLSEQIERERAKIEIGKRFLKEKN